jgi:UDP-N-acetylmuramoylalanine--D-glutamate ligase
MNLDDLRNKQVVVLGFGANNQELTRFLLEQGVSLTIRDKVEITVPEGAIFERRDDILEDIDRFQIAFRSPGIPYLSPKLQAASSKGLTIYSQTKLFMDLCPCEVIGVTGTKGKGTTSSLIYEILKGGYSKGEVYLGGNIGGDPFSFLSDLRADDVVILELSSFQLQDLHKSPHISIALRFAIDHLDHHKSAEEYWEAKARIITQQKKGDIAIINADYPENRDVIGRAPGRVYRYTRRQPAKESAWADGETIFIQINNQVESFDVSGRKLIGEHSLENIIPAAMVGVLYGVGAEVIRKVVTSFSGLEHRLSLVGSFAGVDFYDDSIATTVEACEVDLAAFPNRRIHLIAGGSEKGHDYRLLAANIRQRCTTVSLIPGQATPRLKKVLKKSSGQCLILDQAKDPIMETILSGIYPHLQEGDVVLLAPAAASFGSFANYKERGDAFSAAVRKRYSSGG